MSVYPNGYDDDVTLPPVNDNITETGGTAINAVREAIFNMQQELGLNVKGSTNSLSERLNVFLFPDGTPKPSLIASLGLVTLPITNAQISPTANIAESKLNLDYHTQDLFNYLTELNLEVDKVLSWISITGIKLEPHLLGAIYRHDLEQIDVDDSQSAKFLKNKFGLLRDNTNAYTVLDDLNDDLIAHQKADGSLSIVSQPIFTNDGTSFPSTHAHPASGIHVNTNGFTSFPQTLDDVQEIISFLDSASIFVYGTRIQNLYTSGISRVSRSSSLVADGYGINVVPVTRATAYFLNTNVNSSPTDDIDRGDDIVEFTPSGTAATQYIFDSQFANVRIGDILKINYGTVEVSFRIKEKKYISDVNNSKFYVRIEGKNLQYTTNATARIDRPLINSNKYGVLAVASANNDYGVAPSLVVGDPRGAMVLGVGFDPSLLNENNYKLYLAFYPTGKPQDGYSLLPGIDVTGNQGKTPGKYTLDSVVEATNKAFRQAGFNYRFTAFSFGGEFGIMLADPYNNAGFSIINTFLSSDGSVNTVANSLFISNNVIEASASGSLTPKDALGFGPYGANVASPVYQASYNSVAVAIIPTKLFLPLKRNNVYVNGVERERFAPEDQQVVDLYGDGYWFGRIIDRQVIPGNRVQVTYRVNLDLSHTMLQAGKTLVVLPNNPLNQTLVDYGRFIIKDVTFNFCENPYTDITLCDVIHATGFSPANSAPIDTINRLYFGYDSVGFSQENSSDFTAVFPFKRHFEAYVDDQATTFTHERARFYIGTTIPFLVNGITLNSGVNISKLNIVDVSPKIRGYVHGSINKITLNILNFNVTTGAIDGYLCNYENNLCKHQGPTFSGKIGEVIRAYDETTLDYIDFVFDIDDNLVSFTNQLLDIQLFPTFRLNDEVLLLATCQVNDSTKQIDYLIDRRQFGNTSEKDLSSSALDYISATDKLLHINGVIRGLDLDNDPNVLNPNLDQIRIKGGVAIVNGKLIQKNNETICIPKLKERLALVDYNCNWIVCLNDKGEYQNVLMLDNDPAFNTPNNPNRLPIVYNPVVGNLYAVQGLTLNDIITKRKDLVPLYLVSATVTGSSISTAISLNVQDLKRYVNDGESNQEVRFTSVNNFGNFKSIDSIFNYLKYSKDYHNRINLKGFFGQVNYPVNFDFGSLVIFDGGDQASITFNNNVTLGNNVTFKNMNLTFLGQISTINNLKNVTFENCNITVTTLSNGTVLNFNNTSEIKIIDCNFTFNFNAFGGGKAFVFNNSSDIEIINNTFNINHAINPGAAFNSVVFELNSVFDIDFNEFTCSGNFKSAINVTGNSRDIRVTNSQLTSTYRPLAGGVSEPGYTTSSIINSGTGWIGVDIGAITVENIIIDNVIFNYIPAAVSAERFACIDIKLNSSSSILKDSKITRCKFNNLNFGNINDIRSVINIIEHASSYNDTENQPKLINVDISQNTCNTNQTILVSSMPVTPTQDDPLIMKYPGLGVINCSIRQNVCGTIGYMVATLGKMNFVTTRNRFNSRLDIEYNTCNYIATMDGSGKMIKFRTNPVQGAVFNTVEYETALVKIHKNSTSCIHVGISNETRSSLEITNNDLTANVVESVIRPYTRENATVGFANYWYGNPGTSSNARNYNAYFTGIYVSSILTTQQNPDTEVNEDINTTVSISNNNLQAGVYLNTDLSTSTQTYVTPIMTEASAIISNNIISGLRNNSSNPSIVAIAGAVGIVIGGLYNIVKNNIIKRRTSNIRAYMDFYNPLDAANYNSRGASVQDDNSVGVRSIGIVTENYFDFPTTDGSNTNLFVNQPVSLTYERNINQTAMIAISLADKGLNGKTSAVSVFNYDTTSFDTVAYDTDTSSDPIGSINLRLNLSILNAGSDVVFLYQKDTIAQTRDWIFKIPVTDVLPKNVKLIQAKIGFKNEVNIASDGNPAYFSSTKAVLTWTKLSNVNSTGALDPTNLNEFTIKNGEADNHIVSTLSDELTHTQILANTNTKYLTIDLTNNTHTNNTKYSCGFAFQVTPLVANLESFFLVSPLVITYRW